MRERRGKFVIEVIRTCRSINSRVSNFICKNCKLQYMQNAIKKCKGLEVICLQFFWKIQIFFQCLSSEFQISCQFPGDVADVPGFVGDAGNGFFVLWIAEDEAVKGGVSGQPFSLGSVGEFRDELHADGWAGKVQGKAALVFAGAGSGDVGTAGVELLLAFVGAVTGNSIETQPFLAGCIYQAKCCLGSLFFQKTLGIAWKCVEGNTDVNQVFRNIVGWKRMGFID